MTATDQIMFLFQKLYVGFCVRVRMTELSTDLKKQTMFFIYIYIYSTADPDRFQKTEDICE